MTPWRMLTTAAQRILLGRRPLDYANLIRLGPAGATSDELELDPVTRVQSAKSGLRDRRDVAKHIASAVIATDEAEAALAKHFDCASKHRCRFL